VETLRDKAERFRAMHQPGRPVVLVNAWDAVSARVVESAGFEAIATTSAGVSWMEGFRDGEAIGRAGMLAGIARVARAVSVPVSADLEGGYGPTVGDAVAVARGAIEAGAIGLNFEDVSEGLEGLIDADLQAERIRAIRRTGDELGVPLVINARTDVIFADIGEESGRMAETIRRARLYRAAGADCIFVPGVDERAEIEALVAGIGAPLNVLATANLPSIGELGKLGVARVSLGSRPISHALGALRDAAREVREHGTYSFIPHGMPYPEVNGLFR
jgi:2-methylisocitrate lyase-like PEP mutase family enzyme